MVSNIYDDQLFTLTINYIRANEPGQEENEGMPLLTIIKHEQDNLGKNINAKIVF